MKKVKFCLLIIALLISAFALPASAVSAEEILDEYEQALPDGAADVKDFDALSDAVGFERLFEQVADVLSEKRAELISFFLSLLAITVLSSIARFFGSSATFGEFSDLLSTACSAVCGVFIFERLRSLISTVSAAIDELSAFFSTLVPIATAITASGGGATTAGVQASGMSLSLGIVGGVASGILLPLVSVAFALAFVGAISSDAAITAISKTVRGIFNSILGALSFILGSSLSLQTVIAAATDSMAMRAARYAASSIPVVGQTVSSSLSTLASGLSYAKSAVGVSAVSVILGISIAPLLTLAIFRISLDVCASVGAMLSSPVSAYLSSLKGALDSLIGVFLFCGLVYAFQIIIFMKCGVALL